MKLKKLFNFNTGNRNIITMLVILGSLLFSSCTQEQEPYRVGILSGLGFLASISDGFKAEMAELGYVEGENIEYDIQSTEFDMETYRNILDQFIEDEVDLILVYPTEATLEAKAATEGTDIPVVFSFALIEGLGIVDSISEPGGNITGVRYPGPDIAVRRFEILRQIAPDATRIMIPYQKGYPIVQPQLDTLGPAAEAAGVTIIEVPAQSPDDLAAILQERTDSGDIGVDAILFVAEPLTVTSDAFFALADFAEAHQLPMGGVIFPTDGFGSLFDVNVSVPEAGALAAPLADKILQGADAGTLPVISSDMELIVNNKQAENMELEIPDEVLSLADEIMR